MGTDQSAYFVTDRFIILRFASNLWAKSYEPIMLKGPEASGAPHIGRLAKRKAPEEQEVG